MTVKLLASGLLGDRTYSVQVRAIYGDGKPGEWGPTFAIINRPIENPPTMSSIGPSSVGVRVSWDGTLDSAFDEQWILKKMDIVPTNTNFDDSGVELYRGITLKSFDADLNQEDIAYFAIAKIDKYGNRSTISSQSISFASPTRPENINISVGANKFNFDIGSQAPSNTNKYHLVRIKYGSPFTTFNVTNKSKSGLVCTIESTGHSVIVGDIVQILIGDSRFDGVFRISNATGSSLSYSTTTSETVSSTATTGLMIPTSVGPSVEGEEVFRSEIVSGETTTGSYSPQLSGQKVYIAVGTEDFYKNRVSWQFFDVLGNQMTYGRNYIAQRDAITLSSAQNKSADSIWRYGYVGWKNAHDATTKQLNTASTGGVLTFGTQTADTPDTIRLGVANGSSSVMEFATDPTSTILNSQSRIYPSLFTTLTTRNQNLLSAPLLDDVHLHADFEKTLGQTWFDENPILTGQTPSTENKDLQRGLVWVECSASDIINDSLNTNLPIELSGATSLTGTFTIKPEAWGDAQDYPSAKLSLYAVGGEWSSEKAGVADPHFFPLETGQARTISLSNAVATKARSGTTRTLGFVAGQSDRPLPGESITVSIGDAAYDGTYTVATSSLSTVTYTGVGSATQGQTATTGFVVRNVEPATEVYKELVDSWSISTDPDRGFFAQDRSPLELQVSWNWSSPTSKSINTLRFVWVLEFVKSDFNLSRSGTSTSWAPSTSYVIKLGNFEAWPGTNAYAETGTSNTFSDTQVFEGGVDIEDSLNVFGDLYVDGDIEAFGNVTAEEMVANAFRSQKDIDIIDGDLFVQGSVGLNAGNLLFYTDDYPAIDTNNAMGAASEKTVNSIRATTVLTDYPEFEKSPRWFYVVAWSGFFDDPPGGTTLNAGDLYAFRLYRYNGSSWTFLRQVRARAAQNGVGGVMLHFGSIETDATDNRPEFAITMQNITGGSGAYSTYDGTSPPTPSNRLQVVVLPYSREKQNTRKSSNLGGSPGGTYDSSAEGTGSDPDSKTKSATIIMSTGWKNTFNGDGTENNAAGGDLNQGYRSSNRGNQKSAWGFGTTQWLKASGKSATGSAKRVKILSCGMRVKATDWLDRGGGKLVVGTHNVETKQTDYSSITGKNSDRKRFDFNGTGEKTVDLGTNIGAELWNGHARFYNDFGMPSGTAIADTDSAKGILFGPGPNNSSEYCGSVSPGSLIIEMKIQWKE